MRIVTQRSFTYKSHKFAAQLQVNGKYIKCIERDCWYEWQPEEEVRQQFLYFLHTLDLRHHVNVVVERAIEGSHLRPDIVITLQPNHAASIPHLPVSLVVEIKRKGAALDGGFQQLATYLNRCNCGLGILTNGTQTYLCYPDGKCEPFKDLIIVEQYLTQQIAALSASTERRRTKAKVSQRGSAR